MGFVCYRVVDMSDKVKRLIITAFLLPAVFAVETTVDDSVSTLTSNLSQIINAITKLTQYMQDLILINMEIWHLLYLVFELVLAVIVIFGAFPFMTWIIASGFKTIATAFESIRNRKR